MTKLKFINIFLLQWFFIRLTRCFETKVSDYELKSIDLLPNGNFSKRGIGKTVTHEWYSIQGWILPLTGWNSKKFVFLNKEPFFYKLTSKKLFEQKTAIIES